MAEQLVKIKKKWCRIVAPKMFNNELLGESLVSEPEALIGRAITLNLSALTGEIRQQSVNIRFRITGVENGAATTDVLGLTTSAALIKRLVRRATIRLDEVIRGETADKKPIELKFFMITKSLARSATIKALRRALRAVVAEKLKTSSFEDILRAVISTRFQVEIKESLKKIYPLKACEIKKMSIISATGTPLPKKIKEPKARKEPREAKAVKKENAENKEEEQGKETKEDAAQK